MHYYYSFSTTAATHEIRSEYIQKKIFFIFICLCAYVVIFSQVHKSLQREMEFRFRHDLWNRPFYQFVFERAAKRNSNVFRIGEEWKWDDERISAARTLTAIETMLFFCWRKNTKKWTTRRKMANRIGVKISWLSWLSQFGETIAMFCSRSN